MFTETQKRDLPVLAMTLVFLFCSELATHASLLDPGGIVDLRAAHEPRGAHLLAVTNFSFSSSSFNGKLLSKVWTDDESNPWGGLTFSYRLVTTGGCEDALGWLSLNGFADQSVDVNYFGGGEAPCTATRSASGDIVSFGFFNRAGEEVLESGATSAWLIIQTSAQTWGLNQFIGVGDETFLTGALTPATVPEPSIAALLILAGIAFRAHRARM